MALDIVVPAYNEEHRIGPTLERYTRVLSGPDVRFLVALDRCSDRTADVVAAVGAHDPRVVALPFPKLGKGGVIMEAFRRTDADLVAFVDADCATPPEELARLVDAASSADGAIASRRHPAAVVPVPRSWSRRVASTGFAFGVRTLFGLGYRDTQCGAKVLHRRAIERIVPLLSSRDLVFDVDLLVVAQKLGLRVVEVPTVWIDQAGSRISPVADTRKMALSLLRLWLHHRVMPISPDPAVDEPDTVIDLPELERVGA